MTSPAGRRHRAADRRSWKRLSSRRIRWPRSIPAGPAPVAEKIRDLLATRGDKLFHRRAAERRGGRGVLSEPQPCAALPRQGHRETPAPRREPVRAHEERPDADGLEPGDCRRAELLRPRPRRVPAEAELKLTPRRAHLCAARAGRPLSLYPREPQHRAAAGGARAGRHPRTASRTPRMPARRSTLTARSSEPYRKLKAMLAELRGKSGAAANGAADRDRSSPTWSAGAGIRATSAAPTSLVNLPDFTLKVMHNGAQVWTTRIVIGKPSMATPLLSETMKYITVNPTWTVPQSIVQNEYLPALAQDPTVLERMGLRVSYSGGGVHDHPAAGRRQRARADPVQLPQPLLGLSARHAGQAAISRTRSAPTATAACACRIRPNTPRFSSTSRVRASIGRRSGSRSMFGSAEQDIQLQPTPIWVHLTYQTAFVDNAGKLRNAPRHLQSRQPHHRRHQGERGHLSRRPSASARRSPPPRASRRRPPPDQRAPAVDLHHAGLRQAAAAVGSSAKRQPFKPAVDPPCAGGLCLRRVVAQTMDCIGHRSAPPAHRGHEPASVAA